MDNIFKVSSVSAGVQHASGKLNIKRTEQKAKTKTNLGKQIKQKQQELCRDIIYEVIWGYWFSRSQSIWQNY